MNIVTGTSTLQKVGYRFRSGLFGKQILQIGTLCQDWDTNSGMDEGPSYVSWKDADRYEADEIRILINQKIKG